MLLLLVVTLARPEEPSSASLLKHFIPIPTHSTGRDNEVEGLILFAGIGIFGAIGFGLWFLQTWAWHIIMWTSGMTFVAWARYLAIEVVLNVNIRHYRPETSDVVREMLIEGTILIYLYTVRDAFRKDRKSDADSGARDPVPAAIMLVNEAYNHTLSEYGNRGYEFCKGLMERSPITVPHPTDPTKEVEIMASWYDFSEQREGGPIQIQVCVPYSTPHGVEPPTRGFVVYADGRVVPSEPNY